MSESLSALSHRGAETIERVARETCDALVRDFDDYAATPREAPEPIALWDWPERVELLADALEPPPE